jgi:hypothetical protein
MGKKQKPRIDFSRKDMPDEAGQESGACQPKKPQHEVPLPLVEPLAIDDVEMYVILQRYNLQPLVPLAKFSINSWRSSLH